MSVPHRIVFVQHNFPMFRITFTQNDYYIYINLYKYTYICIIESSPAASPTGLIGHELQCLQRNVWDRRFSAERCVEFEASFFSYSSFVKMDVCNLQTVQESMFLLLFSVKCVRCSDVCLILFPSYTSLFVKLIDCLGDSLPEKNGPVCHRRSAPSLYEMQWSPGASGRLEQYLVPFLLLIPPPRK